MKRNFRQLLEERWSKGKFVCVGLDSDIAKIPKHIEKHDPRDDVEELMVRFNFPIVKATHDLVCSFKPNIAFYQRHGNAGVRVLRRTIEFINMLAPEVPVILDTKDADIGNTNDGYVELAFDYFKADAVTVNPYLGGESLKPFLDRKDKGVFVLCRTSNLGAGEFQDLNVAVDPGRYLPLYQYVAKCVSAGWNMAHNNCGLVVGATAPAELATVREIVGDGLPLLILGIGAQGGDLEATIDAGKDNRGRGMIINSSRSIIFASSGEDFAEAARRETQKLNDAINACLLSPIEL